MISGIHHVVIYVSDMNKAVTFYTKVIGLEKGYESPSWTEVRAGSSTYIGLHYAADIPKRGTEVVLSVSSVREMISVLESRGVTFLGEPVEAHPGTWVAHFTDPDGNALAIYGSE